MASYSNSFSQPRNIADKIADIDAYVCTVDQNPKLYGAYRIDPKFGEHSIYHKTEYFLYGATSWNVLKIVKIGKNVNTSYLKNGHVVYMNEISPVHDNYSSIKNIYFQNDSIIYSNNKLVEEHILQIQCSFNGAEAGHSHTLTISKDSIKFAGDKKIEIPNSLAAWNTLINSFNLADFGKIKTTGFRSYIDGTDLSYVIITDKRLHSFVNTPYNDPEFVKMAGFFKQIDLLNPFRKN